MALSIPTPSDFVSVIASTVTWTAETVGLVAGLPLRVADALTDVELLIIRVGAVVDEATVAINEARQVVLAAAGVIAGAESTVAGAGRVIAGAESTVAGAGRVIAGAESTVAETAAIVQDAGQASATALELVKTWQPIANQAAPLASRLVSSISEEELQAAIHVIDQLPKLTHHLQTDVMPLLATLDRAGPDIHELLDVAKDVREAIAGIPGFTFFRKRGEHKLE